MFLCVILEGMERAGVNLAHWEQNVFPDVNMILLSAAVSSFCIALRDKIINQQND